jgi:hypothetical protein
VDDVVDEVEADRLLGGERFRAELGQRERAIGHAVGGERVDHVVGGVEVGADRVVAEGEQLPLLRVGVAARRRREAVVLGRHVREQAVQRPAAARRGLGEVGGGRLRGQVGAGPDRAGVELNNLHAPIVCPSI